MATITTNETSALASLAATEEALRQTPNSHFSELKSYSKPPLGVLAIIEGVSILLDPSKNGSEWTNDKKLMSGGKDAFLARLFTVDKDNISNKQLEKLKSILARDDCQPAELSKIAELSCKLSLWLRAIVQFATERQTAT